MSRYRREPEVVRLPARAATDASGRAPVRIFLGTEDGQWRAERIFFYAVEQLRDPERTYEIHLMKNLAGFDRRGWRTGFTNYRFAIPSLAGCRGRAIYNDVDQIYLDDPAKLFDAELEGHGYLSVSPEDTSVMLLDCARMSRWWTLDGARAGRKADLVRGPLAEAGTWGRLSREWNARDVEYVPGESKLLHFTALHLQPWRPFPEDYSYHDHPFGRLWLDMERHADEEGYQVFHRGRPSSGLETALNRNEAARVPAPVVSLRELLPPGRTHRVVAATLDDETAPAGLEGATAGCRVDRVALRNGGFDAVMAAGALEACPAEDVPWLLDDLFGAAPAVCVAVRAGGPGFPESDVDVTRAIRPSPWWRRQLDDAARRHPDTAWRLEIHEAGGAVSTWGAPGRDARQTSVWVLEGVRTGDNAQATHLAEALGWPFERKQLAFNRLHVLPNFLLGATRVHLTRASKASLAPPWPDVVIALGKRSSGAARWIREASGGRTRLVHLGRPWARLDAFDLIITTPQYRLPARENVLHIDLPLTPVSTDTLAARRQSIEHRFDDLPRPRIAVLVGGNSWSYVLNRRVARRLGREASRRARKQGGSLLVTTSPRTGARAARELEEVIDAPCRIHRFEPGRTDNPYTDYLAVADEVMVTGDSASMIADAVASGRPVHLFHSAPRLAAKLSSLLRGQAERLRRRTYRGTPKQQGPLARFYDKLVEHGLLTPARDLDNLHRLLEQRGFVDVDGSRSHRPSSKGELAETVRQVKLLFSRGRAVEEPARPRGSRPGTFRRQPKTRSALTPDS